MPPAFTRAKNGKKSAVAAHGVQRARSGHLHGVDAAQQAHHDHHANEIVSRRAQHAPRGNAHGEIAARKFAHRHQVHDGRVHQEINRQHGEYGAENRARNVPPRIVHFPAEIDHAVPPVIGVNHRLQRQNECHEQRPARWAQRRAKQQRSPAWRGAGSRRATTARNSTAFKIVVKFCTPLPTFMLFHCSSANSKITPAAMARTWPCATGTRSPAYSPNTIETAAKLPAVEIQSLQPDNESRVIAQRGPRKIVLPAAVRQQRTQLGKLQRPQRHVDSTHGPCGEV